MNEELNSFVATLIEDTQMMMDEYQTPEMAFTAAVLEKIEDLLDCKDIVKEHCVLTKRNGAITGEIHAYSESENGEVLYLFYTDYNPSHNIQTKTNTECQKLTNRIQGFFEASIRCVFDSLDTSSAEYRASKFIYENYHKYTAVNLIVLSNYIVNNPSLKDIRIATKRVNLNVWDLSKIYGNTHSLADHIAINIDFNDDEYKNFKIPFIQMESTQYGYKCIQALLPAKFLYRLYEKYNTSLLYNNVRYFMGLQGSSDKKPNVAMLDTLRNKNEMFLAYNNGITALAESIECEFSGEKTNISDQESSSTSSQYISTGIFKKIFDFRIINGGQTTAAIFNAKRLGEDSHDPSKKVNLLGVFVQLKLIVGDNISEVSNEIAKFSNFQNPVKLTEFTISNKFNTTMESLSRTIVAPNENNDLTYWFYERLKGQYDEERKTKKTQADIKFFDAQFPKTRRFKKEDVAKVWSNWEQHPFDAVKGASTTYSNFIKSRGKTFIPDEVYYKQTIALLIIYNYLIKRPENKNYANGKATVVAYVMAMLYNLSLGRFNLIKVWETQSVSDNTKQFLNLLSDKIYSLLRDKVEIINSSILSYGKSQAAYDYIKSQRMDIDIHLIDEDKI